MTDMEQQPELKPLGLGWIVQEYRDKKGMTFTCRHVLYEDDRGSIEDHALRILDSSEFEVISSRIERAVGYLEPVEVHDPREEVGDE